jgi:hypothetical protein
MQQILATRDQIRQRQWLQFGYILQRECRCCIDPVRLTAKHQRKMESRFTGGFAQGFAACLASQVECYAETVETSMSKAVTALVRLNLEGQEEPQAGILKETKGESGERRPSRASTGNPHDEIHAAHHLALNEIRVGPVVAIVSNAQR